VEAVTVHSVCCLSQSRTWRYKLAENFAGIRTAVVYNKITCFIVVC